MSSRVEVVLWRHGRSEWNAAGRFQGQLESDLDDLGRRQAADAAERLAQLAPSRIVCSDSRRAVDTCAALASLTGLTPTYDVRLREVDLGGWSGLTRDEVRDRFPDEFADWQAGVDITRGGGETFAQVGRRAADVVAEHLAETADGGPLVLVTHGGTVLSALVVLLELTPELRRRFGPLGNARWSRLAATPDGTGWRLAEHNAGVDERAITGFGDDVARR